jgi:uncharacterized protein (DUF488 family)
MSMIYTIGYQRLSPQRLLHIAEKLKATVVDCRTIPVSRKKGFGKNQLAELLKSRYVHRPDLGGRGSLTKGGIAWLKAYPGVALLMCMEHEPGNCHRHWDICGPHFPEAIHIFEDELFTAKELSRAEAENDGYELCGFLSELIGD